jgi:hypothetical protein
MTALRASVISTETIRNIIPPDQASFPQLMSAIARNTSNGMRANMRVLRPR